MCLEFSLMINFFRASPLHCGLFLGVVMVVMGQLQLQTPCPGTFQYQRDQNGELYGTIGVYSFQDNVDIDVELSIGNRVEGNNNGYLKLTVPRDEVVDKIRKRQPLQYNVYFPRWTHQPPRVTRITLNGQVVCSGPPAQFDEYSRIVSTITLSNRVISSQPLSFQGPTGPENNGIGNLNNPFLIPSGSKNSGNPFLPGNNFNTDGNRFSNQNPPQNPNFGSDFNTDGKRFSNQNSPQNPNFGSDFNTDGKRFSNQNPSQNSNFGGDFDGRNDYDTDSLNIYFPSTTTRKTTRLPTPTDDNIQFSENPFLNGSTRQKKPTTVAQQTPTTTTQRRPTTTQRRPTTTIQRRPTTTIQRTSTPTPTRTNSQSSTSDVCGVPMVSNPLIFNGKAVLPGAFPWLTSIFALTGTEIEYKCCGSLVSHKHVITAAHCVSKDGQNLLFFLGKHNIKNLAIKKHEKRVSAEDIIIHPDYAPLSSDADIAVVILAQDIQFTSFIRPICLWSESDDIESVVGKEGTVVGWGRDENSNRWSDEPKQTTIRIVSQEQCLWAGEIFKHITSGRSFCAGERNNSGPCNGDSGSGFVMKRNDRWFLRGIVSISTYDYEKKSCDLNNYVAYTDASKFRKWLSSIITI